MKTYNAKITTKGRITIPAGLRKDTGLLPGKRVNVSLEDGKIIVRHK